MDDDSVFKIEKDPFRPFVKVDLELARDPRLHWDARGLMVYLLSKPQSWEVRFSDLRRDGQCGREKVRSVVKQLIKAGYITQTKIRTKDGHFRWQHTVHRVSKIPL